MFTTAKHLLPQALRAIPQQLVRRPNWISPLMILAMLALAAFLGSTIPTLGTLVPAIVGALALSVAVLALSPTAIIWLMLVLVLLVVGQLTFFFGLQQAIWLPYLLLLLIAIKYLMEKLRITSHAETRLGLNTISILIGIFCLFFCLSALVNRTDLASVGVTAKNYIFPWFLTLLIVSTIHRTEDLRGIWKFMLWMVFIQVPFAISQHFYFAKQAGADWDAVVGTFGGNFLRGGGSGAMAIFLVFGIVLAASLFRQKQISWKILTGVVFAALVTVALAEVKIFFLCLPLGLILLFRTSIVTNPLRFLCVGMLGAILLSLVLFVYQQSFSERLNKIDSFEGYIEYAFQAQSDPYFFNRQTKELSRPGAILMWQRYNDANDSHFYIGYGPAASRESRTLGTGIAARKYPFTLSTSTASVMLWEVGLIGYILLLGILLAAGVSAFRLARHVPPMEAAALDSIGVMLLLNLPLSLYNRDLIDSSVTQVLLAFWIGYVLLCRKTFPVSIKEKYKFSRIIT